jgi:hypothetical protein
MRTGAVQPLEQSTLVAVGQGADVGRRETRRLQLAPFAVCFPVARHQLDDERAG